MLAYAANVLRRSYEAWRRDRILRLGAGLAYYALFALVPLLAIIIGLASLAFSQADVQAAVVATLSDALELEPATVDRALADALGETAPSSWLGLIGLGSLILAASLLFVALQDALDVIWKAPVLAGFEYTIRRRALAFLIILVLAIVLIAVVAIQSLTGLLDNLLPAGRPVLSAFTQTVTNVVSWVLLATAVTAMLRYLPRPDVSWRAAAVGGVTTTAALTIGSSLFGLYLGTFGVRSAESAAAGVLVVLLWLYTMSQIVLAGAVLTRQVDEVAGPRGAGGRGHRTASRRRDEGRG